MLRNVNNDNRIQAARQNIPQNQHRNQANQGRVRNVQNAQGRGNRNRSRDRQQNVQNDPPKQITERPKPKFTLNTDTEVVINQKIGPEAQAYLEVVKFPDLHAAKRVHINNRYFHGHGFGAWLRHRSEDMVFHGYHTTGSVISIGANASRLHTSQDVPFKTPDGSFDTKPLIERVYGMCPKVVPMDQIRQKKWTLAIENNVQLQDKNLNTVRNICWNCKGSTTTVRPDGSPELYTTAFVEYWRLLQNNTERAKYFNDRCESCVSKKTAASSVDSVYYDGVIQEMEWRCVLDDSVAYFGFFDYHTPITRGQDSGLYWDNEGTWEFSTSNATVYSDNTDNSEAYMHGVLQTGGKDSWIWRSNFSTYWLLCETIDITYNRDVPYRTVRMFAVKGNDPRAPIKAATTFDQPGAFFVLPFTRPLTHVPPISKITADALGLRKSQQEIDAKHRKIENDKIMREEWMHRLQSGIRTWTEEIRVDGDNILMQRQHNLFDRWRNPGRTYFQAPLDEVASILARTSLTCSLSATISLFRKFRVERERALGEKTLATGEANPDYEPDDFTRVLKISRLVDAYAIAEVLAAIDLQQVSLNHVQSHSVSQMRWWADKKNDTDAVHSSYLISTWSLIRSYIRILLVIILSWMLLFVWSEFWHWFNPSMQTGGFSHHMRMSLWDDLGMIAALAGMLALLEPWILRMRYPKPKPKQIRGSCVLDTKRLDQKLARLDSTFKIRNPDWNVRKLEDLPCTKEHKPGAIQIFPVMDYPDRREPTVKHPCPRTQVAASLRAMSNNLLPDPKVFKFFRKFYLKTVKKELGAYLDTHPVHITVDNWRMNYNAAYNREIDRTMAKPGWEQPKHYVYKAFPKVELNPSDVPHYLAHTQYNTVKERQICGPPMEKKILLNPIIAALQQSNSVAIKGYCGNKNLEEISVEMSLCRMPRWKWLSTDGSGFDMTQTTRVNRLYTEIVDFFLSHPHVTLGEHLSRETAIALLKDSYKLDVDVDNGSFNYKIPMGGRASGDGWTTDANTVANIMYYRYALIKQGLVIQHDYFAWFKGDDMIMQYDGAYRLAIQDTMCRFFVGEMPKTRTEYGLGQIIKFVNWSPNVEAHTFLNCNIIDTILGLVLVMRLDVALQKISYSTKYDKQLFEKAQQFGMTGRHGDAFTEHLYGLMLAKILSYKAFMGRFPIFRAWIEVGERLMRQQQYLIGREIRPNSKESDSHFHKEMCEEWQVTTALHYFDFLFNEYGITEQEVLHIEKRIRTAKSLWDVVNIPEFAKLYSYQENCGLRSLPKTPTVAQQDLKADTSTKP